MTRPTTPSKAATPLFGLPRIPYYFTITPYPLSCQGLQTYSLASSPLRMKRRFNADAGSSRGDSNTSNLSSDQTPPLSAVGQGAQPAQHTHLNRHGGTGFAHPEAGSPEGRDSGPESIDGRVLKRMRLIKLDSMSPPADVPKSPQSDNSRLSPTIPDHGQGYFDSGFTKEISPIRISTRSNMPLGSDEQSILKKLSNPVENVAYSGMNVLLHQIHASRFGIPGEGDLGNHSLYHQQQEQRRSSQHQLQHQQQLHQQLLHHQRHQQPHHQQQQQHHQSSINTGAPSYMTAWHQPPIRTASSRDEDDEMTDVEEQMTSATSEVNFSTFQAQSPGSILAQPRQDQLQQHQPHQHFTVQAFTLSSHAASVQAQQQQQAYQPQGPNLYQDINAQLRAAFLARAEVEQRYR